MFLMTGEHLIVSDLGEENCDLNLEEELGQNIVKETREELLMSKGELARKAGVSPLTIDRIEKGKSCRVETRRKIILALGYKFADKDKIFPES
jgi:DNA-binding XRE family transcriptional regulator